MKLALFDLDHTLIKGDSDYLWAKYLVSKKIASQDFLQKSANYFQDYINGTLDILQYLKFSIDPIKNIPVDSLKNHHIKEFIDRAILPILYKKGMDAIRQFKAQNYKVIIITATNKLFTQYIAELMGADDIIATEFKIEQGYICSELVRTPCFQEGKIDNLKNWFKEQLIKENEMEAILKTAYFYSDSHNDIPLLKLVGNPIATNADTKLQQYSKENNWQIISFD